MQKTKNNKQNSNLIKYLSLILGAFLLIIFVLVIVLNAPKPTTSNNTSETAYQIPTDPNQSIELLDPTINWKEISVQDYYMFQRPYELFIIRNPQTELLKMDVVPVDDTVNVITSGVMTFELLSKQSPAITPQQAIDNILSKNKDATTETIKDSDIKITKLSGDFVKETGEVAYNEIYVVSVNNSVVLADLNFNKFNSKLLEQLVLTIDQP